jgi:hypothetical protein
MLLLLVLDVVVRGTFTDRYVKVRELCKCAFRPCLEHRRNDDRRDSRGTSQFQTSMLHSLHTLAMRYWLCICNPENAAQSGDQKKKHLAPRYAKRQSYLIFLASALAISSPIFSIPSITFLCVKLSPLLCPPLPPYPAVLPRLTFRWWL